MNKFDRDIATLRDLVAQRQSRGLRIEDLDTEEERKAYRFWRFLVARAEMEIDGNDQAPTYEYVLAKVRERVRERED